MSIEKTYSLTVKFSKGTAGQKGTAPPRSRGPEAVDYEIASLKETDLGYETLREFFLKKLEGACSIRQGDVSVQLVGTISES